MINKEQLSKIEEARKILSEKQLQESFSNKDENLKRVEKLKKIQDEQKSGTTK